MIYKHLALALLAAASFELGGCAITADPYAASMENVQALKQGGGQPAGVGTFATPDARNSISLRGRPMKSPVGNSYGDYLADALRQELSLAKLLDPKSATQITGTLVKNDVDVSGMVNADAVIEARIVVKRDTAVRFDKTLSATVQFDSNFMGAIAIPRGKQNYPVVVGKFLNQLVSDPDFLAALK